MGRGTRDKLGERQRQREPVPDNMLLLRADLVDFWILAARDGQWDIEEHLILYPNPYPKRSQLRQRWHGHPVFPVMLGLGGKITVRSNWRTYLDEMCLAILAIAGSKDDGLAAEGGQGASEKPTRVDVGSVDNRRPHEARRLKRTDAALRQRQAGNDPATGLSGSAEGGELGWAIDHEDRRSDPGWGTRSTQRGVMGDAVDAAAAYAGSARRGPSEFRPSEPVTNFEAKYASAGESVFELRLEPGQPSSS